jgi:hypothetical protein
VAKLTGKNLYIAFGSTVLSAAQRSLSITEEQETADVTAGADTYRNFANTVRMIEAEAELVYQDGTAGSAILAALTLGAEGTLVWGPEGNTTGLPRKGFLARVVNVSQDIPFDDAITITLGWQMAGTALVYNGITDKF